MRFMRTYHSHQKLKQMNPENLHQKLTKQDDVSLIVTDLIEGSNLGTVYHFTHLDVAEQIVTKNQFRLALMTGTEIRKDIPKNKYYYLSTARTRGISFGTNFPVVFTLDADRLNQEVRREPFDYHVDSSSWFRNKYDETEERFFSSKPIIKNALKYIIRLDILSSRGKSSLENNDMLRNVVQTCLDNNIPVYSFASRNDFKSGTKGTQVTEETLEDFLSKDQTSELPQPQRTVQFPVHTGSYPYDKAILVLLLIGVPKQDILDVFLNSEENKSRYFGVYKKDTISDYEENIIETFNPDLEYFKRVLLKTLKDPRTGEVDRQGIETATSNIRDMIDPLTKEKLSTASVPGIGTELVSLLTRTLRKKSVAVKDMIPYIIDVVLNNR